MSEVKTLHPEIMYAERSSATEPEKNIIYFTINAPDVAGEPKLDIKPTQITFSAKTGNAVKGVPEREYAFDIQLYDEIIPEETKRVTTSRAIVLVLRKKTAKAEYWPRLTKEKPNRNWVKTDFSKWVDEDEQDEQAEDVSKHIFRGRQLIPRPDLGGEAAGMGGMGGMPGMEGMGGMGGMGGMPGMGGMGGPGGMDMEALMKQMGGGMGGMGGGAGGMDFSKMMEQMGGAGGAGGFGADDDEGSDDEDVVADADDDATESKGKGKEKAEDAGSKLEEVE